MALKKNNRKAHILHRKKNKTLRNISNIGNINTDIYSTIKRHIEKLEKKIQQNFSQA